MESGSGEMNENNTLGTPETTAEEAPNWVLVEDEPTDSSLNDNAEVVNEESAATDDDDDFGLESAPIYGQDEFAAEAESTSPLLEELNPRQIVEALDRYIIGQANAKKAVAIALRNRYRREMLDDAIRDEVVPKNILMVGPTGVGKTEIARRLARLADAPFLKVEATKYTEVGYVGRDVESMIRDLTALAVRMVEAERLNAVRERAIYLACDRIVDLVRPLRKESSPNNPLQMMFAGLTGQSTESTVAQEDLPEQPDSRLQAERNRLRTRILDGELDDKIIAIEVEEGSSQEIQVISNMGVEEMGVNFQDLLGGLLPKQKKTRKVTIGEALKILTIEESRKLVDPDDVKREAIRRVERRGILFLDEIDKISGRESSHGPEVSREGVQRDILPIVEGCTVNTKFGAVRTDHILFIAAGAFHVSKPADLIPELQGRFPIRVSLESLREDDFKRILTEPENALTRQYAAMMATEGVNLVFTDDGIEEMAKFARQVNDETEDIGARRLHTILERVLEKVSFDAPELDGQTVTVDRDYVRAELADIVENNDVSRYIL